MARAHTFARDERYPSYFANAIQDFLSGAVTDLRLRRLSATQVQVAPREPLGIVTVPIQGRWRWRETGGAGAVSRAIPGGDGTFDVWVVAEDNNVVNVPDEFTDLTDYDFDLRITVTGVAPTGTGVVIYEKIGEIDCLAGEIVDLRQTFGSIHGAMLEDGAVEAGSGISVERQPSGAQRVSAIEPGGAVLLGHDMTTRTVTAAVQTDLVTFPIEVGDLEAGDLLHIHIGGRAIFSSHPSFWIYAGATRLIGGWMGHGMDATGADETDAPRWYADVFISLPTLNSQVTSALSNMTDQRPTYDDNNGGDMIYQQSESVVGTRAAAADMSGAFDLKIRAAIDAAAAGRWVKSYHASLSRLRQPG